MRVFILCLCVAAAFASPSNVWETFKMTYSKEYAGGEEQMREQIFQKNLDYIEEHNMEADMGLQTYWVGLNDMSDWTDEEYEALLGSRMTVPEEDPKEIDMAGPILSNIDWRAKGAVGPMKNQGSCGSCWAFAAVSSLEGVCQQKTGTLYNLSEQQMIDCSRSFGNHGCRGGWHHYAFRYIQSCGGSVQTKCYRYTGRDETCKFNSAKHCIACKVTGYRSGINEQGLASALSNAGPVGVAVDSSRTGFRNYRSGVYDDPGCSKTRLNHAITAVGYNSNAWIVRNSWGTRWGNGGYILMKRGYNICGIAKQAHYPTM